MTGNDLITNQKEDDVLVTENKSKPDDTNNNNSKSEASLPNPLSKNQLKKRKKLEEYERLKKERRVKERLKQKQKRQEAILKGLPTRNGPSRKELKKRQTVANNDSEAPQIVIDLDFDDLMDERDIAKCIKQCLRMYTINRRSQRPCQLHITGLKTDGRIHKVLKKNDGWENWNINYHFDSTHKNCFPSEKMTYLTCESDNVLSKLEPGRVLIIGGLVDHNHQKGLCNERALQAGLHTARLPLSECVDMKTRSVLSTFHVFEILLKVHEGQSWTEAILQTLPVRKGAKPKEPNDSNFKEINEKGQNEDSAEIEVKPESS